MYRLFADVQVGKKNMTFGIALFLIAGVMMGIPLTINFFGGAILASDQYQTWKVVHGYGVFLAFINYFLGLTIDRLDLPEQHKEIVSWSFLTAGLIGGIGRMILVLTLSLNALGIYASLGETVGFILGAVVFVLGQMRTRPSDVLERSEQARMTGRR